VGIDCLDADEIGVRAGVTTVVDCGSVGVANVGAIPTHIMPKAKTRIVCYLNIGTFAHTIREVPDITGFTDINNGAIEACIQNYPGLVSGFKLRLVGDFVADYGEDVIHKSVAIAREYDVPLMVHIGERLAEGTPQSGRFGEITRYLLNHLEPGDILTHLCTLRPGSTLDNTKKPVPELFEARERGVILDPAMAVGNFAYEAAVAQADAGLYPDTISTDLYAGIRHFHSLLECMAKFLAVGYTLEDVIRMTTANSARALGLQDDIGAIKVGREADISILDVVDGQYRFTDESGIPFYGSKAFVPVQTIRAGELIAPGWGVHPWGWLPDQVAS
jgi:dihydroorotase